MSTDGMRYKLRGRTGLRVSELCLGAMVFGDQRGGWGASREQAGAIVGRFAAAGGNFIDTASNYAAGASESIVGELIAADRGRWVLGTTYSVSARPKDPNGGGNHRKSLVQSPEASLQRLGTSYLDVFWVHAPDRFTPIEEVLTALDDQVRAGKILYTGIPDFPAWQILERELLPLARALELSVATSAPLGNALLTGRYGSARPRPTDTRMARIASAIELGFPHDFDTSGLVYGTTAARIDDHR